MPTSSKWSPPSPLCLPRNNAVSSSKPSKDGKANSSRKCPGEHGPTSVITPHLSHHQHREICKSSMPGNCPKIPIKWKMFHTPFSSVSITTWTRPPKKVTGLPATTIPTRKIGGLSELQGSWNVVHDENLKVDLCKRLKCVERFRGMMKMWQRHSFA